MMTRAAEKNEKPVVAHVNYLFFHSTQSFIFFSLSRLQRFQPICLTRTPEATAVDRQLPPSFAGDFYLYGEKRAQSPVHRLIWNAGLSVRRLLTRLPSGLARPLLGVLSRRLLPRLRTEVSPTHFLDWAEAILRRRKARLIHAYFGPIGWRMLALRRKLGLPLVVTFLGDEVATQLGPWWSWWIQCGSEQPDWPLRLQELFEHGDLFLVEGPFLRQQLIHLGCPPEKVQVQRIAIPVEQMPFACRKPDPDGKVILIFAGRFCEQKGVLYALAAVREIWAERRNIEFRLIGDEKMTDGKYAAQIHTYIRDHDLHDCVRLLGFLNHAEYLREMERGHLFLHPSVVGEHGVSEGGAPTTILEAQALGMPVISTYHCDIPNVTVPDQSALLVPERDSQALAQAIRTLLDDPGRWEQMGQVGRHHVETFHDIDKEVLALEARYMDLLARPQEGIVQRGAAAIEEARGESR